MMSGGHQFSHVRLGSADLINKMNWERFSNAFTL